MNFIKYIYDYFKNRGIRKKKESKIPWVEIISIEEDDEGNSIFSMDWNDAFIEKIKLAGFTGTRDEELIDKYLYTLYSNALDGYEFANITHLVK